MKINALKETGAKVDLIQVFLLFDSLCDPHKDVIIHYLVHLFWLDLVVHTFPANNEVRNDTVDLWLILLEPLKTKDDAKPFNFGCGGPYGAYNGSYGDVEGKRLVFYRQ